MVWFGRSPKAQLVPPHGQGHLAASPVQPGLECVREMHHLHISGDPESFNHISEGVQMFPPCTKEGAGIWGRKGQRFP